jgi:hypothetical protein
MTENGRLLTARQEKAVCALLTEPSIRDAAKSAGIGERTLYTWLKEPAFDRAYRAARREAVARAMGAVQQAAGAAVNTLKDVMTDSTAPAPARVAAAKSVLDLAVKTVEIEDLTSRIEALENAAIRPASGERV